MQAVKDAILEMVRDLPEDCTWEDLMERIYDRQKIEDGLRDVEAGRMTDHEDVFKELADDAIRWSDAAKADLRAIRAIIARDSRLFADRMIERLGVCPIRGQAPDRDHRI